MIFGVDPFSLDTKALNRLKLLLPAARAIKEVHARNAASEMTEDRVQKLTFLLTQDELEAEKAVAKWKLQKAMSETKT